VIPSEEEKQKWLDRAKREGLSPQGRAAFEEMEVKIQESILLLKTLSYPEASDLLVIASLEGVVDFLSRLLEIPDKVPNPHLCDVCGCDPRADCQRMGRVCPYGG
jgi:hypothetical protein